MPMTMAASTTNDTSSPRHKDRLAREAGAVNCPLADEAENFQRDDRQHARHDVQDQPADEGADEHFPKRCAGRAGVGTAGVVLGAVTDAEVPMGNLTS